ncbi:HEPN domain-containing protein [Candidatus Micrarchaeota archaeon]|nr:HEPN domain-containing protein [Candidatus Micrarchaeota archaeon]
MKMMDIAFGLRNMLQNRENVNLVLEYLDCAEMDLAASEKLYQEQIFSLSAYHLQQAVEKTAKAQALLLGVVTRKELIGKVSHESPQIFIELLKKEWVVEFTSIIKVIDPSAKTDSSGLSKIVDSKDETLEIARKPYKEIMELTESIDKIKQATSDKMLNVMNTMLEGYDIPLPESFSAVWAFLDLYMLSMVTYPHATFTRYPDGELKPKDYVKGLGIVDATPELIEKMKVVMPAIRNYVIPLQKRKAKT